MSHFTGIFTKPDNLLEPAADKPRAMGFPRRGVDNSWQDDRHN